MIKQTERTAVERLLTKYGQALNLADASAIPSFYTKDGQFMPEGLKITPVSELKGRGESFFKKVRLKVDYSIQDMVVDGGYAFVQANARTVATDLNANQGPHFSRDFFVLRKEQEEWKIFRYLFHNIVEG